MITIEKASKYTETPENIKPPHGFCAGCGVALAFRFFLKALGSDKAIVFVPPGCAAGCTGTADISGPTNTIEKLGCLFGNTAVFAAGLKSGLVARGDDETAVACFSGDGATFDIGFGMVSGAAERNDDILYVCYDNESYQNTGNQRSSAAPRFTTNTTNPRGAPKREFKKDIMSIMAAHTIPYAATATICLPDDLMQKVQKAKKIKGFKFLEVLCPCPSGWGFPSERTLELSRLAVDAKVFPLYEVKDGVNITINYDPKGTPVMEYLRPQRRFQEITQEQIVEFQGNVDQAWKRLVYLADYETHDRRHAGRAKPKT